MVRGRSQFWRVLWALPWLLCWQAQGCRGEAGPVDTPQEIAAAPEEDPEASLASGAEGLGGWRDPMALAQYYCGYTQGPIPHWLIIDEVQAAVVAGEREALLALRKEALQALAPEEHARHRAVARFLQAGTRCELSGTYREGDVLAVGMMQTVPLIVESAESLPEVAADEAESQWLEAFGRAYAGGTQQDWISLRLQQVDGAWYVDPQVRERFLIPLEAGRAERRVGLAARQRLWPQVERHLEALCASSDGARSCELYRELLARVGAQRAATAAQREAVQVALVSLRALTLSAERSLPYGVVEVENRGSAPLDAIWLWVSGVSEGGWTCRLDKEAPPRLPQALSLAGGASGLGYCPLPVGAPSSGVQVQIWEVGTADAPLPQHSELLTDVP